MQIISTKRSPVSNLRKLHPTARLSLNRLLQFCQYRQASGNKISDNLQVPQDHFGLGPSDSIRDIHEDLHTYLFDFRPLAQQLEWGLEEPFEQHRLNQILRTKNKTKIALQTLRSKNKTKIALQTLRSKQLLIEALTKRWPSDNRMIISHLTNVANASYTKALGLSSYDILGYCVPTYKREIHKFLSPFNFNNEASVEASQLSRIVCYYDWLIGLEGFYRLSHEGLVQADWSNTNRPSLRLTTQGLQLLKEHKINI
ncbi:MAG: hypothetical protein SFU25_00560 [Candidatus Caenarcaniphilales bacterium]|nr:hypothetical protein [Candidatus Caenarcaniphilales bacterium]